VSPAEDSSDPWRAVGQEALDARLARETNHARAQNVIIFVADGAGPTFFTATRIHDGQRRGVIGDTHDAPPDLFPYAGFARTHSADDRVTDSAASATSIFGGVKTHNGGVGVSAGVESCEDMLNGGAVSSLADAARAGGRKVGVVTTTTVTDATPAAVYAHAPDRGWQYPDRFPAEARAAGCTDSPDQLIQAQLDVAIGGGLVLFLPQAQNGVRPDGRDLTVEWRQDGAGRAFVADAPSFLALDTANVDQLLALVAPTDLYDPDRVDGNPTTTPTLAELADVALEVLEKGDEGYLLLIEQEGTDELQHAGKLGLALDAGVEMYDALRLVLERVDLDETLVIVTADHGQPLAMGGGGPLESPLLGVARYGGRVALGQDQAPYPQLGFYVGPRARPDAPNRELTDADVADRHFIPDSAVPLAVVPHSGVDVPVYAIGPWSDLFSGVYEQNAIYTFVRHAMTAEE
jgi:alkaline phosphatase